MSAAGARGADGADGGTGPGRGAGPSARSARSVRAQVEAALAAAEAGDGTAPIVEAGDPVLRTPAVEFDGQVDDDDLARLIAAMRATMRAAPGVGLAAPQVGIGLRLAVLEDAAQVRDDVARARERTPTAFEVLINPRYEAVGHETAAFYEGCLSVPGYQAVVERPRRLMLRAQDATGRATDREVHGWAARIAAHETDHLDGVLCLDRAQLRSLATHEHVARLWPQPTAQRAAQALGFDLPPGASL